MATKIYVTEPKFALPDPSPDQALLCYSLLKWDQGLPPVQHPPCNDETIISISWGESAVAIQQKIIDKIVATLGVSSNDIIFLGAWV